MSKLHWTQTPEGKRRMSEIQKKAHAELRARREELAQNKVQRAASRFRDQRQSNQVSQSPTIVIQGWSITVVGNQLRIEKES